MSADIRTVDGSALAERVYRGLLRTIIDGDLTPGAWLKERDLSERFEVSRVPVRQALQRLEVEGFVTMSRNRGASVTPVTMADVEELFDARLCIEPYATRLAATRVHAGEADPSGLRGLLERALAPAEVEELGASNLGFHREIVRLSGNRILERSLLPMLGRMEWMFRLTRTTREQEHDVEHQQLLDAILAGRGEVAAAQAHAHIAQGREPILEALSSALDW
ncbi:GntR family transcriptional regulator [Microbacterium sp. EST19A]|uniref:GntR family transcriptional regulator n=1 Tax=Microbacterium sp. EST19A TaxID=2862681 RepID=UPI001CBAE3D6|nr:GntR family transcriptional regulator [Microbacterium sp. EST19A]